MPANYVLLQRIELNASAASVTFSNIPQSGYTDLKIVISNRTNNAAVAEQDLVRFNGVTTGYSSRLIEGSGSSVSSQTYTDSRASLNQGTTSTSNTFTNSEIYIPNYTSSNFKSYSVDSVTENNATAAYSHLKAILWSNTAAISSIAFTPDAGGTYAANSTFSLYGLAAVGTTPVIAPKATGGNITSDGTYWIHTFNSTGTFTPLQGLSCDYLVVAGGGGGGNNVSGGAGAGGLTYLTTQTISQNTNYTVTVGAGGAGSTVSNGTGASGSSSVFNSSTSNGGSGGIGNVGSGGASGSPTSYTGGAAIYQGSPFRLLGGGGAGSSANGGNATATDAGNGGAGTSNSITGSSVAYAGAGGGGTYYTGTPNAGTGSAGGGNGGRQITGGVPVSGTAATANSGSGGGGGSGDNGNGGNGGSGIVIIRYPIA